MDIKTIGIIGGQGKGGQREPVDYVELHMGDVASIVGPTGSGKTAFINDVALFADDNTPSRRRVLINGAAAPAEFLEDPSRNPVAMITQHTTFMSDLPVGRFLETHARIRHSGRPGFIVDETIDFANQLTGEPVDIGSAMTQLSGGQTRALLIADAVVIGNAPIILLDEIENAGIDRSRALELLRGYEKIFIFVTHDLRIALLSDYRLVMQHGALHDLLLTDEPERRLAATIDRLDQAMLRLRDKIRRGERLTERELDSAILSEAPLP